MEQEKKVDRSAMAAKIQALLSKTIENGATEAEAMMAAAKASELIARYEFNMTVLEIEAQKLKSISIPINGKLPEQASYWMAAGIAELSETRGWRDISSRHIFYFGLEADVQFAEWLAKSLISFTMIEVVRWWKTSTQNIPHLPAKMRMDQKLAFVKGCSLRISSRMYKIADEKRKSRTSQQASSGQALVVIENVKSSMIEKALSSTKFKSAQADRKSYDHHARLAGAAAGERAGIDRPIGGSEQRRLK